MSNLEFITLLNIKIIATGSLRKRKSFTKDASNIFSTWEIKNKKLAYKYHTSCLKQIKKAKTEDEVKNAIKKFVDEINKLPNIETSEREDTWEAVCHLVETSELEIATEIALKWFDEYRDF